MTLRTLLSFLSFGRPAATTSPSPQDAPGANPGQCGVEHSEFRARLQQEAYDNLFTPAYRAEIERALDRCYRDRPTTYVRKLRVINGGRR